MARGIGGGLSIDSDPIGSFFLHTPISTTTTTLLNSFTSQKEHSQPQVEEELMDATVSAKRSPSTTTTTTSMTPFQVNLSCSQHHESPASPQLSHDKRPLLDEMDFFSDHNNNKSNILHGVDNLASASSSAPPHDHHHHHPTNPDILEFKVNTGLNLLTTNTSSDQSMVDDDISTNSVDKRAKTELVVLQAELERMKVENHRLRDMLDHVNTNYNALQMHLVNLMQDQKAEEEQHHQEPFDGKLEEKKQMVPRQFMDLGLAINNNDDVADEPSLSSSVGKCQERSKSPANNLEVASKELGNRKKNIGNNASGEGVVFDHDKKGQKRREMALPMSMYSSTAPLNFNSRPFMKFPISVSLPIPKSSMSCCGVILCRAAANSQSQTGPVKKKRSSSSTKKKKKKKTKDSNAGAESDGDSSPLNFTDFEILNDFGADGDEIAASNLDYLRGSMPLPEPPAGFLVGDDGRVLLTSTNRLATIVDPSNNLPLECVIRRVFRSSEREECMLLCPVDTPVQILKSTNVDGWSAISDEEVESILPAAAYALAKIHMHLVYSGYCYTARGGFCYSEEDIFDFHTDDDKEVDGLPTEGVEITYFNLEGAEYMIYTPSDPLLFVAVKDENGMLQIADDDLLEDPAIIDAIDEETEFNALVQEEEAALRDSMMAES